MNAPTPRPRGYYLAGIRNALIERTAAENQLAARINEAMNNGVTAREAAAVLGISRSTLYRLYRWTQPELPGIRD